MKALESIGLASLIGVCIGAICWIGVKLYDSGYDQATEEADYKIAALEGREASCQAGFSHFASKVATDADLQRSLNVSSDGKRLSLQLSSGSARTTYDYQFDPNTGKISGVVVQSQ